MTPPPKPDVHSKLRIVMATVVLESLFQAICDTMSLSAAKLYTAPSAGRPGPVTRLSLPPES
ncbi:MAG: hypothetical protein HUU22_19655 [Phycisphaerae bacterium]|nr:hypothetical protein [Phycisphaerae bacterium]NUQ48236.1 hypothetical protein [Phycisphaerae bacterium]